MQINSAISLPSISSNNTNTSALHFYARQSSEALMNKVFSMSEDHNPHGVLFMVNAMIKVLAERDYSDSHAVAATNLAISLREKCLAKCAA